MMSDKTAGFFSFLIEWFIVIPALVFIVVCGIPIMFLWVIVRF